jgi:tRNA threonylcarbamoyladenosine biosynthesis protein TsaB
MIVLGIETATQQVGCALGGSDGVLASFHATTGRRHAETLAPAIEFMSRQAGVRLRDVRVVAVDIGPGLFTSLRVGVATAKAMAQGLRVPMIGLSSLDLLAFSVRHSTRLIVPVIDARRREVFSALYRSVPGGVQRVRAAQVTSPEELASELVARNEETLLVGEGALRYATAFQDVHPVELEDDTFAHPSAAALVELARPRALREEFVQAHEIQPLYLRKPDAEINWEQRRTA